MNVDVHTLSGAYALDALSAEERETFREHLVACQACRDEVRELRDAAVQMGSAQWSVPPPALRASILEAAARTPQQPPVSSVGGGSGGVVPMRRRWPALLGAAAAAVTLVAGGVAVVSSFDDDSGDLTAAPSRVFEADDVRRATVETGNGGSLTVGISESRNEMAVDARELPDLDRQHVYQLWTVRDDSMVSAAILTDGTTGAAMGLPAADTRVALTIEPAGGSEQPTSEPIVELDPTTV
jgi:anti-sigma factor RsiW